MSLISWFNVDRKKELKKKKRIISHSDDIRIIFAIVSKKEAHTQLLIMS